MNLCGIQATRSGVDASLPTSPDPCNKAELLQEITSKSDNIYEGEMIHVLDRTDDGITTFTDRGVERLQEFLADVPALQEGVRQFLPALNATLKRLH